MSRRKCKQVNVVEDKKIAINTIVQNFMEAADQKELKLPPIYNVDERAYIHKLVIKLGLKSKSHESCQERNQVCKIICTQPRRLSAISVAERVAFERSEKIGETFGYQIRLETKVSSKTLLTYCTNGIFLRTLISEDSPLSGITHVIVDEVHERDRLCDFLLIALKDALVIYKHLKVILMSATIDTSIFSKYFYNCPIIRIPGKLYEVDIYYLEDVLQMTNYFTKEMLKMKNKLKNYGHHDNHPSKSVTENQSNRFNNDVTNNAQSIVHDKTVSDKVELESWFIEEIDKAIEDAWLFGGEDRFTQILYLICSENVPVDYQHSKNFVTTLMIAAGRGYLNIIQNLVNLGANLNLKSCNNWTAYDWARNMNQIECAEFIEAYTAALDCAVQEDELVNASVPSITEDSKALLDIYHSTFNDENINYDLLLKLILHIHLKMPMGSILVFLPGYDEINNMKNKIIEEVKLNNKKDYNIYILHSNAQISDQKQVFKPSPRGCRKFILSTNIAETSITINDVVYVIDCGKVKEKSFDVITGVCTFESNWISQACAKQRTGRAGRCQKVMEMVCGIKNQLVTQLKISGFIKPNGRNDINYLNSNSKNWAIIKAALTAGLYPNLIRFDRTNNQLKTERESKVRIHSLSVLKDISKSLNKNCTEYDETNASSLPCEWILYEELIRCGRYCSAKNVTLVNSLTVAIFSGSTRSPTDIVYKTVSESNNSSSSEINRNYKKYVTLKLDDWIVFQTDPKTAELILYLRQKWNALFLWHMKNPYKFMSQVDEEFMKILIAVMNNEEQASKLYQSLNL
ncbi:PREDICTED: probable ATP-dependent RNA helicase YTHDC2 [Ceratosolen solmsi marchali]|uniref:Probable ATP-dependent RNA helicase YTHDC2 n=1 Tax=Ceratosolen solmsi marchali TaxID=326594 RepID=A0AAJ7DW23_9HYME|nr:PREDICTED: probable ATP-dependent RNA helicase YTHDC2 [Ceratosolen solmsi marchali]